MVPLTLLTFALLGRFVSIALDGTAPTTVPPIIAEAVMIALLGVAYNAFGKPTQRSWVAAYGFFVEGAGVRRRCDADHIGDRIKKRCQYPLCAQRRAFPRLRIAQ